MIKKIDGKYIQMTTPFDFVKDLSFNKKNIYNEETEKEYIPFIINRAFSYHIDTVIYANEMNMAVSLDKKLQHDYFINIIRKSKRFANWYKKNKDVEDKITLVMEYYGYNHNRAKEVLSILSDDQINVIQEKIGKKNE